MLSKSRVKYIQTLYHKKFRDETGTYLIEGPKLVHEFLTQSPSLVLDIFATREWLDTHETLTAQGTPLHPIDESDLERISQLATPNQVVAVVKKGLIREVDAREGIVLLLDDIQDPGNLGTIIRLADWFGVAGIVCGLSTADCYNSKVVQATMGSILRVPVQYCNLHEWIKEKGQLRVYAAVMQGRSIAEVEKPVHAALLIGNESRGISEDLLARAQERISIPRKGGAESLNAAVATGILLGWMLI